MTLRNPAGTKSSSKKNTLSNWKPSTALTAISYPVLRFSVPLGLLLLQTFQTETIMKFHCRNISSYSYIYCYTSALLKIIKWKAHSLKVFYYVMLYFYVFQIHIASSVQMPQRLTLSYISEHSRQIHTFQYSTNIHKAPWMFSF